MKKRGGLTLLELTIVTAVLITVLVFIGGNNSDYRVLRNTALMIQADFRYAQRRAVMEGQRFGIRFDTENNRYHIITASEILRTVDLPDGVVFTGTTYQNRQIMYTPRGTAAAGRIEFEKGVYQKRITTTVGGGRAEIFDVD
jgi:Tfp pilus assembly protein FimT